MRKRSVLCWGEPDGLGELVIARGVRLERGVGGEGVLGERGVRELPRISGLMEVKVESGQMCRSCGHFV